MDGARSNMEWEGSKKTVGKYGRGKSKVKGGQITGSPRV